ncbi:Mbov_0400 family ICE element protein [Mesomycoplasma ovipneumoniae]|uniref:Mbov_0400 family ICE element protein n=1 Tax=Mesomycoplasma ovipneumoniae TaxID=29562 RepID=UPI00311B12E6
MTIKDRIKNSKWANLIPFKLKRTLVFDSLGQRINSTPVIIFHDSEDNYYYYIKARDARLTDWRLKKRIDGEVLISKSNKPNALFTNDFYLDCSQIFYIHGSQLDELTKKYPETEILDSKELQFDQVKKMFDYIYECLRLYKQPFIVISKVSYDSKTRKTKSEVEYASDWHLEHDYDRARKQTKKPQKIKEFEELKDKLKKDKDIVELKNLEIALSKARKKYNQEKIYNPLFDWINKNKFIQEGLNSLEIIREYRKLPNPIVPINVDAIIIYNSLLENRDLAYQLMDTDYKFMLDWFKKNDLDISTESFKQFRESMQQAYGLTEVFYYHKLEDKLDEEISKLVQKQTQNQKPYRDELTYRKRLIVKRLKKEKERLKKEQEQEQQQEESKKDVPTFKMKM